MDGGRVGRVFRAVRVRQRLRQVDVALRAGVSAATVNRIEHGRLVEVRLSSLLKVAQVLDIRLEMTTWWRGGDLDRMLNSKHAALAESAMAWLLASPGWEIRPEVSFNIDGERGIVDLLAWHPATRTLLVMELKTDIVDVGELLGTFDRKRRLAWRIAATQGWRPESVGCALVLRESRTNRRRVEQHTRLLRASMPDDGRRLRSWLLAPTGPVAAITFLPDLQRAEVGQRPASDRRVRVRGTPVARPNLPRT
jgi:transcriptional regulator with XRE-family HTH domain